MKLNVMNAESAKMVGNWEKVLIFLNYLHKTFLGSQFGTIFWVASFRTAERLNS